MTVLTTIAFAAFLLEDDNLVTFYEGKGYFTYYLGAFYGGSAYLNISIIVGEENLVEFNHVTFFDIVAEEMNVQELAGFCLELLSLNVYNCVH